MMPEPPPPGRYEKFAAVVPAPRLVRHRPHEPAGSRLVRLAVANERRDVRHLVNTTPNRAGLRLKGQHDVIEFAARLGGFDLVEVAASTPLREHACIRIGSDVFSRKGVVEGRICSECVRLDLLAGAGAPWNQSYQRAWWMIPQVATCHLHGIPLVNRCPVCSHSFAGRGPLIGCGCAPSSEHPRLLTAEDVEHDAWLVGRTGFDFAVPHAALDPMTPQAASRFCLAVGRAEAEMSTGRRPHPTEASILRSVGWRLLNGGPDAFAELLDAIARKERSSGRGWCASYFGLHRFFLVERSACLDDHRARLIEHAGRTVAIHPAKAGIFARERDDAAFVTINRASVILGVSKSWILGDLRAFAPADEPIAAGSILLTRRQLSALEDGLRSSIPFAEALRLLGIDRPMMLTAIEVGIIKTAIPTSRFGSILLDRRDVEALLRRFRKLPVCDDMAALGSVAFAALGEINLMELLHFVWSGRVRPVGRIAGLSGLPSLLFRSEQATDLRMLIRREVSKTRIMRELRLEGMTIPTLQSRGMLGILKEGVLLSELARFRDEYVTAREIAAWLPDGATSRGASFLLRKRWVEPAIKGPTVTSFWRRSDAVRALRPLLRVGAHTRARDFGSSTWLRRFLRSAPSPVPSLNRHEQAVVK